MYQFELGAVTLAAHRNYAPGEPLCDSHGQHLAPADIFLDYGTEVQEGPGARHRFDVEATSVGGWCG